MFKMSEEEIAEQRRLAAICAEVGHDYSGDSYEATLSPDTGSESFCCNRCGFGDEVVYY